jgi:hypothetical protein
MPYHLATPAKFPPLAESGWADLNRRLLRPKRSALPTALHPGGTAVYRSGPETVKQTMLFFAIPFLFLKRHLLLLGKPAIIIPERNCKWITAGTWFEEYMDALSSSKRAASSRFFLATNNCARSTPPPTLENPGSIVRCHVRFLPADMQDVPPNPKSRTK